MPNPPSLPLWNCSSEPLSFLTGPTFLAKFNFSFFVCLCFNCFFVCVSSTNSVFLRAAGALTGVQLQRIGQVCVISQNNTTNITSNIATITRITIVFEASVWSSPQKSKKKLVNLQWPHLVCPIGPRLTRHTVGQSQMALLEETTNTDAHITS